MLNVNWSAFLGGILPTLQNIIGTMAPMKGANYIGGEDLRLLLLPVWSTNVAWAIVNALAALEVSYPEFFATFHPILHHSTHH